MTVDSSESENGGRKNPAWTREELILALDLYLRFRSSPRGKDSAEVKQLSETLNSMAAANEVREPRTYRNANGVYMKMMNFRRFDPEYTASGKVGLTRGNQLEEVVWNEFASNSPSLTQAVAQIRGAKSQRASTPSGDSRPEPGGTLIKVNADACPRGIGVPNSPSDWESGSFKTRQPGREGVGPSPGDRAMIWVNEERGGKGLTACCKIVSYDVSSGLCTVSNIHLFPEPLIGNQYLAARIEQSTTFKDIRTSAVRTLRPLSKLQWNELFNAALTSSPGAERPNATFSVLWHEEGPAKDTIDVLPAFWFHREGYFRDYSHDVKMPSGPGRRAKCDVTVRERTADLNYAVHEKYNAAHDMFLGIMRLHFTNAGRHDIEFVEWADMASPDFDFCDTTVSSDAAAAVAEDIAAIRNEGSLDNTTREQLIRARIGQGRFRYELIRRWDGKCSVSGANTPEALRASHVKPWRNSTNQERLDADNGLLLTANLDALFDKYLISFDDAGEMLVSPLIPASDRTLFDIPKPLRIRPSEGQKIFLQAHRDEFEKRM